MSNKSLETWAYVEGTSEPTAILFDAAPWFQSLTLDEVNQLQRERVKTRFCRQYKGPITNSSFEWTAKHHPTSDTRRLEQKLQSYAATKGRKRFKLDVIFDTDELDALIRDRSAHDAVDALLDQ